MQQQEFNTFTISNNIIQAFHEVPRFVSHIQFAPNINLHHSQMQYVKDRITNYSYIWSKFIKHYLDDIKFVQIYRKNNNINYSNPKYGDTIIDYRTQKNKSVTKHNYTFSRAYFKLWEILQHKNFLNSVLQQKLEIACLAQGPGGFINALIDFRGIQKKDNYYAITLKNDNNNCNDWNHKSASNYLNQIIKLGYNIKLSYGITGTGDLLSLQNIEYFANQDLQGKKCQLITADGGIQCANQNEFRFQQLHNARLFLAEVITALSIQKYGGTFILKIYDFQFATTIQLISIICLYYKNVQIIKPEMSRAANSQRYVVAQQFLGIPQCQLNILKQLLQNCVKNSDKFCTNLIDFINQEHWFESIKKNLQICINKLNEIQMEKIENGLRIAKLIQRRDPGYNKQMQGRIEYQLNKSRKWCKKYNFNMIKN